MKFKITNSTGKFPVFTMLLHVRNPVITGIVIVFGTFRTVAKCVFVFFVCFILFVSGPAHILCLTVASG